MGCQVRLGSKALWLLARVHYGQLVPGGLAPGKFWGVGRASQQGEFISFSKMLHAAQAASRHMGAAYAQGVPQRCGGCWHVRGLAFTTRVSEQYGSGRRFTFGLRRLGRSLS